MKPHYYAALLALASTLVFAQAPTVDPTSGTQAMDTVFLANVTNSLNDYEAQEAALAKVANAGYTSPAGMALRIVAQNDIQNYQDSMNGVIDANNMAHAPQQEYRHLVALGEVAAKTKDVAERKHLLGNFIFDSRNYLRSYPDTPRLWVMRGAAALQLNKQATGAEAAKFLLAMPPAERTDPRIQKLVEIMGKKGWLPPTASGAAPAPTAQTASAQLPK